MDNKNNLSFLISEILKKEYDRFSLSKFGFENQTENHITKFLLKINISPDQFQNLSSTSILNLKNLLISEYYDFINFEETINSKQHEETIIAFIKQLMRKALIRLKKEKNEQSIDKILKPEPETIAFLLTSKIFNTLYNQFTENKTSKKNPYVLYESCFRFLITKYPLSFPFYYSMLEKNDKDFWEKTYEIIKKISTIVTIKEYSSSYNKAEIIDNVCNETSIFLHGKITDKTNLKFETPETLKSYIYKVCINKLKEHRRSIINSKQSEYGNIEEIERYIEQSEQSEETNIYEVENLDEIDINNEFEVATAISVILCNKNHRLRKALIGNMEDKVTMFIMKYVEDKQYEEIIKTTYGKYDNKLYAKTRQDMVRTKEKLIENFKKIYTQKSINHGSMQRQ